MPKPAESTAETSAGQRAAIPAAIFLVVLITHLNGVITSFDSIWSIPIARSLLREGNIDLDEYTALLEANRFYAIESINGHYYSVFPIGVSLLAVPVVYAIDAAGVTLSNKKTERLVASLIVALTADLVQAGGDASQLVKPIAQLVQGSGGGRKDMAQAGGKDPSKLTEALAKAPELLTAGFGKRS